MKSITNRHSVVAVGMCLTVLESANAEVEQWCKTSSTSIPNCTFGACDFPENRNASVPDPNSPPPPLVIRVRFNLLTYKATDADASDEVDQINNDYFDSKISFDVETVRLTSSPHYNTTVTSIADATPIKEAHANNPATKLNVYVVDIDFGGPVPVRGWAVFPFEEHATDVLGGIVIDPDAFGTRQGKIKKVLTHEIGHVLSLWHSWHGSDRGELLDHGGCPGEDPTGQGCNCNCYEAADRTDEDADLLGDLCGDTPATPAFPEVSDCDQPNYSDVCSSTPWPAFVDRNFMSTKADRNCPNEFTPQQGGRMHCWACAELAGWIVGETLSGACCLPDGSCEINGKICCEDKGGTFGGDATTCTSPEACCTGAAECSDLPVACCTAAGGTSPSGTETCGPTGACCLPNGRCVETGEPCCDEQSGLFAEQFNCSGGSGPPYVFCGP